MALPKDFAARVRAARAYAGIGSQKELGEAIGRPSGPRLWERGNKPDEAATGEIVRRLARATGLPEWFFTIPSISLRDVSTSPLDRQLASIETTLARIEAAVAPRQTVSRQMPGADLEPPRGGFVRSEADDQPSQGQNPSNERHREAGPQTNGA